MEELYFNSFPKPPKREKKQPKPLSNRRKVTGEAEMFREIWETANTNVPIAANGWGMKSIIRSLTTF